MLLVKDSGLVYMFNSAAKKLFGFASPSDKGMQLEELPLDNESRMAMQRQHKSVVQTRKQAKIQDLRLTTNRFHGMAEVHFTPLSIETGRGMIVMFQVGQSEEFPGPNKGDLERFIKKDSAEGARNKGGLAHSRTTEEKSSKSVKTYY